MKNFFKNALFAFNDWFESKWGRRIWTIFVVAVIVLYSSSLTRNLIENDVPGAVIDSLILVLYFGLLWLDLRSRHRSSWADGYVEGMVTGIKIAVGAGPDVTGGDVEVSVELDTGRSRIVKESYDYRERDDTGADPLPEDPKRTF